MTKLTDTQRAVLTTAAERPDGAIQPLPANVRGGAITKMIHALLAAGFITPAPHTITPAGRAAIADAGTTDKPAIPAALEKLTVTQISTAIANLTGQAVNPKAFAYKEEALDRLATEMTARQVSVPAALKAAGIEAVAPDATGLSGLGHQAETTTPEPDAAATPRSTRDDSKQAKLIAMLKRPQGASAVEIAREFGWQAHTVRGAIAGALKKKLGLDVTSTKEEGRGRVYRIGDPSITSHG